MLFGLASYIFSYIVILQVLSRSILRSSIDPILQIDR